MALSKVSLTPAMSTQVQKVEVTSPLIQYEGSWSQSNDQATFISCDDDDNDECLATLQLNVTAANGTKVMAFVAGCGPLSRCGLQVDSDPEVWGQFHNDNDQGTINATLDQGPHNVTMKGKEHFTLHYFNWTSTVHSTNDKQVPNDANAFVYAPQNAWNTNMADRLNGQMTIENNATATFSFKGDRVALYGAVGPQGGEYTTQLDDGPLQTLTEQRNFTKGFLPNQLIFYADGLDVAVNHTVTLVSTSTSSQVFTVDYAIVDGDANPNISSTSISSSSSQTVPSPGPTITITSGLPSISNSSSGHSSRLTQAQLIGIITGIGAFLILLILALAYILYSRHVRRKKAIRAQESFDDFKFPSPHPVGAIDAFTLPKPAEIERIPTRYFEPERARSFYSQSSATLDDSEGYQAEMGGKHKIESYTYARDSRGYLSVEGRDRRQSVDRDADNSSEVGAIYAI